MTAVYASLRIPSWEWVTMHTLSAVQCSPHKFTRAKAKNSSLSRLKLLGRMFECWLMVSAADLISLLPGLLIPINASYILPTADTNESLIDLIESCCTWHAWRDTLPAQLPLILVKAGGRSFACLFALHLCSMGPQ